MPTLAACKTCDGSGAKPGTGASTCRTCNGHGKVRAAQGFFTIERTCPACQGRGQTMDHPCTDCGGQGRRQQNRKLSVDIPKGIEDGTRIRLANEGEAGLRGGPPGDLYIFISLETARPLPARRRRPLREGADRHDHRGARRRVRRADARGHRRQGEGRGRHPARPARAAQGQGHAGAAVRRTSATSTSSSTSRRRRT